MKLSQAENDMLFKGPFVFNSKEVQYTGDEPIIVNIGGRIISMNPGDVYNAETGEVK